MFSKHRKLAYPSTNFFFFFLILLAFTSSVFSNETPKEPTTVVLGAGATSSEELYKVWSTYFESYRSPFKKVSIKYASGGSSFGLQQIIKNLILFAGSDIPLTTQQSLAHPDLKHFPSSAWGLVLGFNIPNVSTLVLSQEAIVGIYNGSINLWTHPSILKHNPNTTFPNQTILPIARLESSGSTFVFTSALSSFDAAWEAKFGVFQAKSGWPSVVKLFGQRTTGLTDQVLNTKYSIGYLALDEAVEMNLPVASLINNQNMIVSATIESIQKAMITSDDPSSLTSSLVNSPSPGAYPIATFAYIIVNTSIQQDVCDSVIELYRYVRWFLGSREAFDKTAEISMVPLTSQLVELIQKRVLNEMRCRGALVRELAEKQIWEELESLKTWKIPVIASSVVAGLLLILLVCGLVYQRYAFYKKATRKNWKIDFFDFIFKTKNDIGLPETEVKLLEEVHDKSKEELQIWSVILSLDEDYQEGGLFGKQVRLLEVDFNFARVKASVTEGLNSLLLLNHTNVASFIGISSSPTGQTFYLEDACSKGCVTKLLCHPKYPIGSSLRFSIARELCSGLLFLHKNKVFVGALHIHQCMIDARWTTKISQWGLYTIDSLLKRSTHRNHSVVSGVNFFESIKFQSSLSSSLNGYFKYWIAPEYSETPAGGFSSEKADIYSYGAVLCAVFSVMKDSDMVQHSEHVLDEAYLSSQKLSLFRPYSQHMPVKVCNLVNLCCSASPTDRPSLENVQAALRAGDAHPNMSVLDHVISLYEGTHATASTNNEAVLWNSELD